MKRLRKTKKPNKDLFKQGKSPRYLVIALMVLGFGAIGLWQLRGSDAATDPSIATWRGDYNTCNFSQWDEIQVKAGTTDRYKTVTSPLREGACAARVEVRQSDQDVAGSSDRQRMEFKRDDIGAAIGKEQWFKWSVYLPSDFSSANPGWSILSQWHSTGGLSPNLALEVNNNSNWRLAVRGGQANQDTSIKKYIDFAPLERGTWADFELHVKWATDNSGYVTLWMNGSQKIQKTFTPTFYVGGGIDLKQGIYRQNHAATAYVIHDGMRVGTLPAGYTGGGETDPDPEPQPVVNLTGNLALNKAASASGIASAEFPASKITDGQQTENTDRWRSSPADNQWVQTDLGSVQAVGEVQVLFTNNTTKTYDIQVSTDGINFTTVATGSTAGGQGAALFKHDIVDTSARYVRMLGKTRWGDTFSHSVIEMGAYAGTVSSKQGDLNGDNQVNIFDLSILLIRFNQPAAAVQGDLNADGMVTISDLSILMSRWGA